jgi:hypothetical protein
MPSAGTYDIRVFEPQLGTQIRHAHGVLVYEAHLQGTVFPPDFPHVSAAYAISENQVVVIFSCDMDTGDGALEDESNYTINEDVGSAPRTVSAATIVGPTAVLLTLDGELTPGVNNYEVEVQQGGGGPVSEDGDNSVGVNTADFGFTSGTISATFLALTNTTVKVTFSVPVLDNEALRCKEIYVADPPLEVYVVTPEAVANPTYVILTVQEMKQGHVFDMDVKTIEAA